MKIAFISDIHSNIFALREVIKDLKKRECDVVLCLGDYIGYYYWPNQVLDMLRALDNSFFIRGNHENMYYKACEDIIFREKVRTKYGHGIEYALTEITEENRCFLKNLTEKKIVEIDGLKIGMFHGSPVGVNDYVYPDVSETKLSQVTSQNVEVILLGHTHHQFVSLFNNKLLINPGSVGQARDVRGLASYAVFNTKNYSVIPVRLDYDKSFLINKIEEVEINAVAMLKALSDDI